VLYLARRGSLEVSVSGPVYAEYEEVLRRPRFRRIEDAISPTLHFIRENGFWVRPTEAVRACADADDDIFLECAQTAGASWLVTGNTRDFPSVWQDTAIVTPRQFLDRLAEDVLRRSNV